jgi:hypothetical protein
MLGQLLPGSLAVSCYCCGQPDLFVIRYRTEMGTNIVRKGHPTCLTNERICDSCEAKFKRSNLKRIK